MNPPPPFPSPYIIFNPSNVNSNPSPSPSPNPNPSPNLVPSHPQLRSSHLHPPRLTSDLPTTLSVLDDLLRLSESTLGSLASVLPCVSDTKPGGSVSSNAVAQCPLNPNHLMPPEYLFLHSLKCPSPLDVGHLLDDLHYPKTLKSEDLLILQNKFSQPLEDPNAELCFSLEDYMDFDTNFFYRDCPGIVRLSSSDSTKRMFSLPGILAVECANFSGQRGGQINELLKDNVMLLPSEVWAVRCGVEQWSDYPLEYSYSVLKVFLGLDIVHEFDLLTWMISNSPRFGIVIDVSMRDHIFVLFRLCLKAVMREAARSLEFVLKGGLDEKGGEMSVRKVSFKCPILVDAFKWLASQLAILYGIEYAKSFTVTMLKNLILNVASNLLFWSVDQKLVGASAVELDSVTVDANNIAGQTTEKFIEDDNHVRADAGVFSRPIFVYQIGAAIASLHERSLLEERLRALRNPQQFTAYQRVVEHAYWSKIAEEERLKLSNYRPLLEQDGLLSQRLHDQGTTNKTKSREELLAEERDYKRRRTSYRGKKLKRTTKEVMRDIIEEHMEAIREAGGIGFSVKGEGGKVLTSEPVAGHDFSGGSGSRADTFEAYETRVDQRHGYNKQLPSGYDAKNTKPVDAFRDTYYERRKGDSRKQTVGLEVRGTTSRERYYSKYHSRSPDTGGSDYVPRGHRIYSRVLSNEQQSHTREHDVDGVAEDRHYRREPLSSSPSEYHGSKYRSSTSRSGSVSSRRKDRHVLEASDRRNQRRHEDDGSGSSTRHDFTDRYDPSRSQDMDDHQSLSHSKYVRPVSPH
ncbi:hypothetical protein Dimus_021554 [Dionaea muscipula]